MKDVKNVVLTMVTAVIMYVVVMYVIAPEFITCMLRIWVGEPPDLMRLLLAVGVVAGLLSAALVQKFKELTGKPPLDCFYRLVVHPYEKDTGSYISDRRYEALVESGCEPVILSANVFSISSEWRTAVYAYVFTDAATEYLKEQITEGICSNLKKTAHNSVQKGV